MKRFSLLKIIVAFIFFSGCIKQTNKDYIKLTGFTQGTTYGVIYYDSQGRNFSNEIESILLKIDTSMSVYNPKSAINAFNNSESGIEVDTMLAEVVKLSSSINEETYGAFDITVGPLVSIWGFHMKKGEMPTKEKVDSILISIGSTKIELHNQFLSKTSKDVMIDVNAIAQGYTVDVLARFLKAKGVNNFLIELGGEIITSGQSPRGDKWIVGVDKPVDNAAPGESFQVKLSISNSALVTSGNYRKFFVRDGVKYSHTIDPKTGFPVTHSLLSATVIDRTAARADALATAFMVMGVDSTKSWLARNPGVEVYLIYSNTKGDYEVWMSEGVRKMIKQ